MNFAIGVDIGGTKIAIGLVKDDGTLIKEIIIATNLQCSPYQMIDNICSEIKQLLVSHSIAERDVLGIGIGAPGPLNINEGMIVCPPNLPNWKNVEIVKRFRQAFPVPIFLQNDANAATLAEKWLGAAVKSSHFIYLTISTGIGAGIYSNGNLVGGASGNAGDVGHMVIDPKYGKCTCGQYGCFEWIASGTSIARLGSTIVGKKLEAKEVFEFYNQGHQEISQMIENVFTNIGVGCVSLINSFDPELIVIGGGVSKVGEPLFKAIRKYVSEYSLNPNGQMTEIVPSGLAQQSGVIGAAALVILDKADRKRLIYT
ncbi:ROK family protein [Sporosarcina jiandibaonis]|uniref:ROK family protein n=1 Tax=Sporosarcina jiandibaonis TaxID=2715535 RepID=UPI00155833AE|nr:ROK family protein [Sporosarcina jiandibaonis]